MMDSPKAPSQYAWAFFSALGTLFIALGAWLLVDPWAPPYGGKAGFVFHLAYNCIGQYGPAAVFTSLGVFLLFVGLRQRKG
ncbi:MAG: hypothetical protein EOO33_07990 [Comamonadaceae bacterium]|nr:MAG: hypothetical protein EOO33_07990 [Comamonadaceae bacterium]